MSKAGRPRPGSSSSMSTEASTASPPPYPHSEKQVSPVSTNLPQPETAGAIASSSPQVTRSSKEFNPGMNELATSLYDSITTMPTVEVMGLDGNIDPQFTLTATKIETDCFKVETNHLIMNQQHYPQP